MTKSYDLVVIGIRTAAPVAASRGAWRSSTTCGSGFVCLAWPRSKEGAGRRGGIGGSGTVARKPAPFLRVKVLPQCHRLSPIASFRTRRHAHCVGRGISLAASGTVQDAAAGCRGSLRDSTDFNRSVVSAGTWCSYRAEAVYRRWRIRLYLLLKSQQSVDPAEQLCLGAEYPQKGKESG